MSKYLLVFILAFFVSLPSYTSGFFSDLNVICENATWVNGSYNKKQSDKLILPHIDGRITNTEGYIVYNGNLYMVANTHSDNFQQFLGAYLLRYNCGDRKMERLSGLLKKWYRHELASIDFNEQAEALRIVHRWHIGLTPVQSDAIFDLQTEKLYAINSRKFKAPKWKMIIWGSRLDTYDGESIEIVKLYYTRSSETGNYTYDSPDVCLYNFATRVCTAVK